MKKQRWEILFEDEELIIVNKPAPFLTIPDRYDSSIPSLIGELSKERPNVFVNHRLDKETSGLILFTKTEEAHKQMSLAFEERRLDKHYLTLVHNKPLEEVGLIDLKTAAGGGKRKGMVVSATGKETLTKYRILESFGHYSYLEVKILTGRQHQIRVHMKEIRCPVICDSKYGDGEPLFLSKIKRKMNKKADREERPLLSRVALHAYELKFEHPISKESMSFQAPLPKDMKAALNQLRKWD